MKSKIKSSYVMTDINFLVTNILANILFFDRILMKCKKIIVELYLKLRKSI